MAALDFPASPTLNQVYSANGRSWIWNGTTWNPYGSGIADGDRGDITVSNNGATWTVDDEAITYAKIQNVSAASRLLGRGDSGAGDVQEITLGSGLSMTGTTLSATGGGTGDVVGPASSTDEAVARFDLTTGKLLQNSVVTITDAGIVAGATQLNVDNLRLDGNTLSSTDVNGNISLTPNGTGVVATSNIRASGSGGIALQNSGGTSLISLGAGGGVNATIASPANIGENAADYHQVAGGTGTITDTAAGSSTNININLVPKGTGRLQASGVTVPTISSSDTLTNKTISGSDNTLTVLAGTQLSGQVPLANGGTGANLTDPNADRILFWDDSAGQVTWLTAGTGLTISGTTITSSGGSAGKYARLSSDFSTSNDTTLQNITGLSFSMAANTAYYIVAEFGYTANASTTGLGLGMSGPASPTSIVMNGDIGQTATTFQGATTNAYGLIVESASSGGATARKASVYGLIVNGANSGTFQLQAKSESGTAGTITLLTGGALVWQEVTT